jgi:hypothetical protein
MKHHKKNEIKGIADFVESVPKGVHQPESFVFDLVQSYWSTPFQTTREECRQVAADRDDPLSKLTNSLMLAISLPPFTNLAMMVIFWRKHVSLLL